MVSASAGRSLLQTEAASRAALIEVHHTAVSLDLTDPKTIFRSSSRIDFSAKEVGAATFVDFKGTALISATLNGTPLPADAWAEGRIALTDLQAENVLAITGTMAFSSDGEGLHRHIDPADGEIYLYAMSFLDAGPRWFACFDQPDLKSRYTLSVDAPQDWTVIGNGPSRQVGPGRWEITPPQALSTYFVTLVAGPYASVLDEHRGIPLGIHVRRSLQTELKVQSEDILTVTKQSLDYYEQAFAMPYPFGEYHQAFVPDFNAGAMENPGCVTFRDQYIFRSRSTESERASRAGTIAHEMAHMWFGDLVTMRWWDDLWLNESFAEYMSHRCSTEATRYPLWTEFGIRRKEWGSVADQSPSTHPVAGNGSADAWSALSDFDGISYAKGAAVLKQLVAFLGDDVFFGGVRQYFVDHAYGNAEFADLINAWTAAGAQGLDQWAAVWLRTAGMDTLDVAAVEGCPGSMMIMKTPPPASPDDQRPHALTVAALAEDGSTLARTPIMINTEPVMINIPAGTAVVVPDADDDGWARIRLGDGGFERLLTSWTAATEVATTVVLVNAIRDAVRGGDLDPRLAMQLICRTAPEVQDPDTMLVLLRFAIETLSGPYAPVGERAERRSRVHEICQRILASGDRGSDRQYMAFRMAVRSSDDIDLLDRWRRSIDLPVGIALDHELTWALVSRIAVFSPDAPIDETLQADRSAAGLGHAVRARAILPTDEAKAAAWELLMRPSSKGAYEIYAAAEGFFVEEQHDLTRPYAERFFAEIPATAEFRTGWALGRTASIAYPLVHAERATVDAAEQVLAGDLADGLRRALLDGNDKVVRAVAALEGFPGHQ